MRIGLASALFLTYLLYCESKEVGPSGWRRVPPTLNPAVLYLNSLS